LSSRKIFMTVIMPHYSLNFIYCQIVMTKTLTGYDVLVYNKDILNNVIFAFRMSLSSERHLMTVVINMHKPYLIYAHPFK